MLSTQAIASLIQLNKIDGFYFKGRNRNINHKLKKSEYQFCLFFLKEEGVIEKYFLKILLKLEISWKPQRDATSVNLLLFLAIILRAAINFFC